MDFTDSFAFGSSTFDELEIQVKYAIEGNERKDGLDVILESPTEKERFRDLTTSRSRLFQNSRNETNKRCWRRSKSDSKLLTKNSADVAVSKVEHFTQFFDSDFAFSLQEEAPVVTTEKTKVDEESRLRVSHFEDALNVSSVIPLDKKCDENSTSENVQDLDDPSTNNLDIAVGSEDIRELLENSESVAADVDVTSEIQADVLLDATNFICPIENDESAAAIKEALELGKQCLKEEITAVSNKSIIKKNISPVVRHDIKAKSRTKSPFKDLENLKHISAWSLPASVLAEYEKKGILKMFDWQIQCLSNPRVLFEHCNLVYSAPTSAGKTLVSEILLLKTVLERNKKALMILPFISVVREKMSYLQDLLTPAGYRVEGFFGGYSPPGGFDSINVAICTIEKANSIVNKLLELKKLETIGIIVVDEIHLISDPGRGYILELLLAKILYMSRKYGYQIQVITMSATLANVELLKCWLDAELYITNYRPVDLQEMIKIGSKIYDCNMKFLRDVKEPLEGQDVAFPSLSNDMDNVAQLCLETILDGCSVIVFCPSKDWCEKLAVQLANVIHALGKSGSDFGQRLREQLNRESITEVKKQLKDIPTGLDSVLEKTITFGCAFHHAGLTTEERDIVEASFKSGALRIIVATSTLSSGVNLPARRVLIRTPLFGGKQMSSLTYKQMIGRAGRTGKDTLGESILICTEANARTGRDLVTAELKPITSCLEVESSTHLKRALLEVISASVALTRDDIVNFVNCTLLSAQKRCEIQEKESSNEGADLISAVLDFLMEYEFVRKQLNEETQEENYIATRLGQACLASSIPPTDGLILFSELQKSRRCFVLESELHAVYLVTPYSVCYQMQEIDWLFYLDMWEKLTPAMKTVGELVGVKESFLVRAMRGQTKLDYKLMQIHKRFYTALALQELVNETPINVVAQKYKCTRGLLQSLQQMASTFAGIVTAFCNALQWDTLSLIVSQFKERLFFGIHRDLIDLMRLPDLNHKRARILFDAGITTLVDLAQSDVLTVEKLLHNSISFDLIKQHENENSFEAEQRNNIRNYFITGKPGLTVHAAAKLLVNEARRFVEYEIGAGNIKWSQESEETKNGEERILTLHMSCEEQNSYVDNRKRKSTDFNETPPKLSKNEGDMSLDEDNCKTEEEIKNEKKHLKAEEVKKEASKRIANDLLNFNVASHEGSTTHENEIRKIDGNELREFKNNSQDGKARNSLFIRKSQLQQNDGSVQNILSKDCAVVLRKLSKHEMSSAFRKKSSQLTSKEFSRRENLCPNKEVQSAPISKLTKAQSDVEPKFSTRSKTTPTNHSLPKTSPQISKTAYGKQTKEGEVAFRIKESSPRSPLQTCNGHRNSKEAIVKPMAKNITSNSYKNPTSAEIQQKLESQPRRSPRNHTKTNQTQNMQDLFAQDLSFELNSGLCAALEMADQQIDKLSRTVNPTSPGDEIPGSQQFEEFPIQNSPATPQASSTRHGTTRFLRSYRTQRPASPLLLAENPSNDIRKISPKSAMKSVDKPNASNSIDISMDISSSPYAMQMNATHILSCAKEDTISSNFNYVDIVEICGSLEVFTGAFDELLQAKRFGFSLGIQELTGKKRPLIGANLLINQIIDHEKQVESLSTVLYSVNDSSYVDGIAFCIKENVVYYMNMQENQEETIRDKRITKEMKLSYLRRIVCKDEITLVIYEARKQLKCLRKAMPDLGDICVKLEDPKVANWLLQPDQRKSLKQLAQQFAPECQALVDLCGGGRGYNSHGIDARSAISAKIRCSIEACVVIHILQGQIENLERIGNGELKKFFHELEMPLQLSLCNMEIIGFPAYKAALSDLFHKMLQTLKKLETRIFSLHGKRFNLNSASAVGRVLGLHRKPNGRISTSRQVLEKIDEPIAQLIIAYRKLNATMTKNIQPLLQTVEKDRIHGQSDSFTATGRISMKEPNLQNVAKDFEIDYGGEKIQISSRRAFFPKDPNRCLISADFCQLEMRILAHMAKDPQLLKIMNSYQDVFTAVAAGWNCMKESEVSEQLRNGTKQICYGIIYGMGMRALAEALKCNEDEAKEISSQFHEAYPGIRSFTNKIIEFARRNGYIETIQGRRRYLENINSEELSLKNQAERQAVNSAIQGSAADIAKKAILRTEKSITKYSSKLGLVPNEVQFVLHVHDELIFEVPTAKAKKIAKVINLTMEACTKLEVPLRVKLKMGRSWGEMKEIVF